jgi:dihydroorotase
VIGFETAFAVLYQNLVLTKEISLERLIDAMSIVPSQIMDLPASGLSEGNRADVVIVDLKQKIRIDADSILSKSKNSPWLGEELQGKVVYTICDGRITFQAEQ